MKRPSPSRSAASSAACPPAPNVASTIVSPGWTESAARTSSARTGTWSVAFGSKTLGNMLRTPFDLGELGAPRFAVPDLEVVVEAGNDHVAPQPGMLDQ